MADILEPEAIKAGDRGGRQVNHGECVIFLQSCIGCPVVAVDGDIFRFRIAGEAGAGFYDTGARGHMTAIERNMADAGSVGTVAQIKDREAARRVCLVVFRWLSFIG